MFLKQKELKKLMRSAWSGAGLMIARNEDYYILEGPNWVAWIRPKFMPKEIKAAMIEFGGEIPLRGQAYQCWKKEAPQYELLPKYDLEAKWGKMVYETKPSLTYVEQNCIKCNVLKAGRMILLDEHLLAAVGDPTDYDYNNGEYDPGYPMTDGEVIMWQNNACYFLAAVRPANDALRMWLDQLEDIWG